MRLTDDDRQELAALVDGERAHKGVNGEVVPIERARRIAA
jgi:hypothetical protein